MRAMIFENSPTASSPPSAPCGSARTLPCSSGRSASRPRRRRGGGPNCPPDIMGAMAAKIPDARHVTSPLVGHLSNLEAPEKFNAS